MATKKQNMGAAVAVAVADRLKAFAARVPPAAEVVVVAGHATLALFGHELATIAAPPPVEEPALAEEAAAADPSAAAEVDRLRARIRTLTVYVSTVHDLQDDLEHTTALLAEATKARDAAREGLVTAGTASAALEPLAAERDALRLEVEGLRRERDLAHEVSSRLRGVVAEMAAPAAQNGGRSASDAAPAVSLSGRILECIRARGAEGGTFIEVADALGAVKRTVSGRMSALAKSGALVATDARRGGARGIARVYVTRIDAPAHSAEAPASAAGS